jgi:drug/metabolite transporter (DMT)-like permease
MKDKLSLLAVAAIWGSTFIVVKDVANEVDPFVLLTWRFAIASVLLLIIIKFKKKDPLSFLKWGVLTGVIQFMTYAPQAVGLKYTSASNSAFITGLFIMFVPIAEFIINKRKPQKKDIIVTVVALIGLWILTGGINQMNFGDVVTLITAAAIGFYIVVSAKALDKGAGALEITFQQTSVVMLISLTISIFRDTELIIKDPQIIASAFYLAIFGTVIAYVVQNRALERLTPIMVSLIVSTEPFFALLFAWVFSFESFDPIKLLGGCIIVTAILIGEIGWSEFKNFKSV